MCWRSKWVPAGVQYRRRRKNYLFSVCINVNLQVIQCFCLRLFSLTNFFENEINFFYIALGQNSTRRRNRKWLKARAVFVFMVSLSSYGWSFVLWSFHIGCNKTQHMLQVFQNFSFSVATVKLLQSTFVWVFPVKLTFGRRHRAISYPNTFRDLTRS